jgi:hypothetical protein
MNWMKRSGSNLGSYPHTCVEEMNKITLPVLPDCEERFFSESFRISSSSATQSNVTFSRRDFQNETCEDCLVYFTYTLLSLLFKAFDVNSQVPQSGRNVLTQLTNFPHTKSCWDLKARALSRYSLSKAVSASHFHPTPLKRDLIPEDVSHVGGLSLIISPTRDRMGLAPWSEVQSLCERTKYTRKLPSLWIALLLYTECSADDAATRCSAAYNGTERFDGRIVALYRGNRRRNNIALMKQI